MTQRALGQALGISDKAVSGWERNDSDPEAERIPEIAKALKVPLKWLWEGSGPVPDQDDLTVEIEALSKSEQRAVRAFIENLRQQRSRVG